MIRIIIKRHVEEEIKQQLKEKTKQLVSDKFVLVGIPEEAGSTKDGSLTMAQLGATLHFGTQTIPARPWLDVGVKTGTKEYSAIIEKALQDGENMDNALEKVGQVAVGKVQQYMTDLRSPPNAESTKAKKGSSNPLIDSRALVQSVTYSIVDAKQKEGIGS